VTYIEAVAWLYGLQLHGIRLGLEQMLKLCVELRINLAGEPDRPAFIHVAGTNGKGSVCAMLASVCREAGIRTGLYTSPHLVTFRERIRLDGEMIPETAVAQGLTRIRTVTESWDYPPTFFEVTTALALEWFQMQAAEVVVLETGLGGRLDATNVVIPAASVLTPIAMDHQRYLGDTIAQIAAEKCGIIKPGVPVISAGQAAEAAAVIRDQALAAGSDFSFVDMPIRDGLVGLIGAHQRRNAALASQTLSKLRLHPPFNRIGADEVERGIAGVRWPGRFQLVGERFILDGAHNPASATALVETWRDTFGSDQATIVLGMMRDKDVSMVCAELASIAGRFLAVTVGNPRSCSAEELKAILQKIAPHIACEGHVVLRAALQSAEQYSERVLICGSLFLIGEALFALGVTEALPESSSQ
jgi:dihydrofolate synthase / folylpolyglutamate synthase